MSSESSGFKIICFSKDFIYKKNVYKEHRIMKRGLSISLLCVFMVGIDQFTKYAFYNQKIGNQLFFLEPLLNDGISRGMSMPMMAIIIVSVICLCLFVFLFYKKYLTALDFALLFAGTIGNLIDRVCLGGVRDFLSFGTFPVFNIADSFLTCGVAWICIKEIFHLQKGEKNLP